MGTISSFIRRTGSVLTSLPKSRNTSFETCLIYDRNDGKRIEFVVSHLPNVAGDAIKAPDFTIGVFKHHNNPNCRASALVCFSMEETRMLRDFLNRPEATSWLEEEA